MTLSIENRAALDFVLMLRRRWADTLYPRLCAQYEARFGDAMSGSPQLLATRVHDLAGYAGFAWLERGSQKMLWRAAKDAIESRNDGAGAVIRASTVEASTLELDPELDLPDWYTDWDIHLQPGGVWSSTVAADVYELGAKLVMQGDNDDYRFHRLFLETAIPPRQYRRIVDLGCGFGKSTWLLKKAYPRAEVVGVDFSEPCLRLAVRRANAQGLAIRFRQADAADTRLEAGTASLLTATMLVHELPLEVLSKLFEETARLLEPGGLLRILDFQFTGEPLRDLAMREHGLRNNEPFMPPMMAADTVGMARAVGLRNVRWTAFDERTAGRMPALDWPRRTEWHFPWAVLEAEKPV